jgi:hypothetical protein
MHSHKQNEIFELDMQAKLSQLLPLN